MSAQIKIKIELTNLSDSKPQVYTSQSNTMVLKLTNQSGLTQTLNPGTPQNPPPVSGQFSLALDLSSLFTAPKSPADLQITAAGWTAKYFGTDDFPAWVLCPEATVTWPDKGVLTFTISNLTPSVATGTYYVSETLYGLGTPQPILTTTLVADPPTQSKLLWQYLAISMNTKIVTISKNPKEPVKTKLILTMYNQSPAPLVPDSVPWTGTPKFIVSFVSASEAPGFFALATPDSINAISVGIEHGSGWQPPSKLPPPRPEIPAQWLLTPDQLNHHILGGGIEGVIQFSIMDIATTFINGPTLMYIQYTNIPGYQDGYFTVLLDKQYAPLQINHFHAGKTSFEVTNYQMQKGYLGWKVSNSSLVELSGVGVVPSSALAFEVEFVTNCRYVLTAYDIVTGNIISANVDMSVSPPISQRWTPLNSIAVFAGAVADIPPGFVLCDGRSPDVPDLQDRFILGAGQTEVKNNDPFPKHNHNLSGFSASPTTMTAGTHSHGLPATWYSRSLDSGKYSAIDGGITGANTRFQDDGAHAHGLNASFPNYLTDNNAEPLRPEWYALCYIIYRNLNS
jgi:hypothetical protein